MINLLEKIKKIMDNALWMDLPIIEKDILDLIESEKQAYAKEMCIKLSENILYSDKLKDSYLQFRSNKFISENFPEPKQEQNG